VTEGGVKKLIHGLVKLSQFCVSFITLWSQNGSFQAPQSRQLLKSVFVPILIYGHESWVMTEKILSQVQGAEIGLLRRVRGVTLHDKLRSCDIHRCLNVEPLFCRIERSQLRCFGHVSRMSLERLTREVLLVKSRESGPKVVQGPGGITYL